MGELYFGTPGQRAYVVFDTGSNWVTVTSAIDGISCAGCDVVYYDVNSSSTANVSAGVESMELAYGSADLSGIPMRDSICLKNPNEYPVGSDDPTCLENFKFMAIDASIGLTRQGSLVGGILGLGPDVDEGPSFLLGLKD
mmetsp:Transcript_15667/g.24012  ORF Transcript_15667/g.24012 Transcript_15667/m.24012 type:complete len:140 (-) Transcript_15667:987-1406(-)